MSQVARLQQLFAEASELPASELPEYLAMVAKEDFALAQELKELLAVDVQLRHRTVRPVLAGIERALARLDPQHSLSGSVIPPYQVGALLGQGGMGSVYRAERVDGEVKQTVAMKFVRRELVDEATLRRFKAERDTLAALDHPHIARLLDAKSLADGTPYFVMEYIDGIPITQHCAERRCDLEQRLRLFLEVCDAIKHAHRNLIVHRDLKPGNILVDGEGRVKLLDFGIAKSLAEWAPQEQTGTAQRFFSPAYAAPEQLLGLPVTVACDIYALGLMLYELLTGVSAFDLQGLTAGQAERLITQVPPPAPSTRVAGGVVAQVEARQLRGDLDSIVLRCLRKGADERYGSVEQLEDDLNRYLDGRPISLRSAHTLYRLRKFVGRHRLAAGIVALAALALSLALIGLFVQNRALLQERDLSRQSLGILKGAFLAADPIRTSGTDTRAGQILDAARTRIDDVYETQPELYASLAETMAEVDLAMGRAREASVMLARADDAALRAGLGIDLRQRLMILQADALIDVEALDQAERMLRSARSLGPDSENLQLTQAKLHARRKQSEAAIAILKPLVERWQGELPSNERAGIARLLLAETHRMVGNYADSLQILDDALRWQRSALPESHPLITRTRMRRITPLRELGRGAESLAEANAVAEEVERLYGPASSAYASVMTGLASALLAMSRDEESLAASAKAVSAWQRAMGRDHPSTLRAMFNHAYTMQFTAHRRTEAERIFRELMDLAGRRLGEQAELVVYFRLKFAEFLRDWDRPADALALLVVRNAEQGLAVSHPENRADYLNTIKGLIDRACPPSAAAGPVCQDAARLVANQGTTNH